MKRTENMLKVLTGVGIKDVADVDSTDKVWCPHCRGLVVLVQGARNTWHARHLRAKDARHCSGSPMEKQ